MFPIIIDTNMFCRMFLSICGEKQNHAKRLELLQYWNVLQTAGFSPTDSYWKMLKLAGGEPVDMSNDIDEGCHLPRVTIHTPGGGLENSQVCGCLTTLLSVHI